MSALLLIFVCYVAYNVAGCIVLGMVDSEDKLMHWYKRAPNYLSHTVFWLFWPGVVLCYLWSRSTD